METRQLSPLFQNLGLTAHGGNRRNYPRLTARLMAETAHTATFTF